MDPLKLRFMYVHINFEGDRKWWKHKQVILF